MRKPYHIVAPAYTEKSAGVKALHMLCDALNKRGETALIVPMDLPVVSPALDTPIALRPDEEAIVVYPEIIEGNPLDAKHVVRWLLYYAGTYRGNKRFLETDMVWGYTTRIAADYGTGDVLFLPTVDENFFVPPSAEVEREGTCYYAHKHRTFYGGTPAQVSGSVEITNPGQSRDEVLRLLQTSKVFYTYEDTALMIEAVLCGCPVICVPSEHFKEGCGLDDFNAGIAWGLAEFGKALTTLGEARYRYQLLKDVFEAQLTKFIDKTQIENV